MLYLTRPLIPRNRDDSPAEENLREPAAVRWRAVWLAGTSIVVLTVARIGQPILVTLWGTHLGWNEAQISLLMALGAGIELLALAPGGRMKDSLGRSPVLACCLTGFGAGFGLMVLWSGSWGLLTALVVMSLGNGLASGINMTIGADLSPATGRARFLSIWSLFNQVGTVLAPLIISGMLLVASLPWAIVSLGLLSWTGVAWTTAVAGRTGLPGRRRG
jgi:permease of the major facilitator superfamily protein